MSDLEELVCRARQRDVDAFEALVRRFQDMAVGCAYAILGDFGHAEDAAQEAFIRAFMCIEQLRDANAFPGWLRTIVVRQCGRHTRRKRIPTVSLDAGVDRAALLPFDTPEHREMRELVRAALAGLSAREREATTLFYINGYSMAEVGAFLDVPVTTVKSRLHSARGKLRERMVNMVENTLKADASGSGEMPDRIAFLFELAKPLAGGVPLLKALKQSEGAVKSTELREVVHDLQMDIQAGQTFSGALARYPDLFPAKAISLIRDGEYCGRVAVFTRLAGEWLETGRCEVDPYVFTRCVHASHWFSDAVDVGAEAVLIRAEEEGQVGQGEPRVWLEFLMPRGATEKIAPAFSREEARRLSVEPEPFRSLAQAVSVVQELKLKTVLDAVQDGDDMTGMLRIRLRPDDSNEVLLPIVFSPNSDMDEVRIDLTSLLGAGA